MADFRRSLAVTCRKPMMPISRSSSLTRWPSPRLQSRRENTATSIRTLQLMRKMPIQNISQPSPQSPQMATLSTSSSMRVQSTVVLSGDFFANWDIGMAKRRSVYFSTISIFTRQQRTNSYTENSTSTLCGTFHTVPTSSLLNLSSPKWRITTKGRGSTQ